MGGNQPDVVFKADGGTSNEWTLKRSGAFDDDRVAAFFYLFSVANMDRPRFEFVHPIMCVLGQADEDGFLGGWVGCVNQSTTAFGKLLPDYGL